MTSFSVTNEPCRCGFLERYANDPEQPVHYDAETHEYNFDVGKGTIRIRHCFFCGGKAPESLRSHLFAVVSHSEIHRLNELTKNIKSLDDAIARLGPPDYEAPEIETDITPHHHPTPEISRSFRSLVYSNLSETADVVISDRQERGIKASFRGKYIGRKDTKSQSREDNMGEGKGR